MTFRKSLLHFFVLSFALFFWKTEIFLVTCFIGSHRSQSQHIVAQASQKFNMCDFVASSHAFIAKAGTACEHWCTYIERHRAPSCVLLTHVWKPPFMIVPWDLSKSSGHYWDFYFCNSKRKLFLQQIKFVQNSVFRSRQRHYSDD